MQLQKPDPSFTSSRKSQRNFMTALQVGLWAAGVLWFITITNEYLDLNLGRFGLRPRDVFGLWGVLTAPMLHGGPEHMFSNTAPLIVSITTILYLYPNSSVRVIPMIWLGSGLLAWFIGRPNIHIGASGFVYGLLAYVFVSGMIRQDMRSIAVSMLVWFLYGSMIWGLLPIRPQMSWEMHLTGAILGVAMALVYRKWDRVPIKRYEWEDDDTVPEWFPEPNQESEEQDDHPGNSDGPNRN
ncbi:MAG: rhomboid family intramembrane serine protease [Xanthomonadales bacterium]|nr:rhomboid family intramembrane serine protease [Xanthomonadales bacterium]